MKITFEKQHLYLMNLLIQDAVSAAIDAGDKAVAKVGKRLINKFQLNASYTVLKKRELVLVKQMLDMATKIAESSEIPESDDEEVAKKHLETKNENVKSMHKLQDLINSKITGEKIVKKDLTTIKPDFAAELGEE